jgi:predicted PurR-regulated permease PerM
LLGYLTYQILQPFLNAVAWATFSVLGGIKLFGFIGFIIGSLVLALFFSVFEMFRHVEGGDDA